MIRHYYDLYPRTAPRDGPRVRRFSQLQEAGYIHQRNGTGSGGIALRGTSTDAADIDPLGLQYVRVVEANSDAVDGSTLSGFDETVIGGIFLDEGDYLALDRNLKRTLTFRGAGPLSYLARAAMAPHTYLSLHSGVNVASDPKDGTWNLFEQGTAVSAGDFLGAAAWRCVWEAMNAPSGPYAHIHADGTFAIDTHDDDRPETAIPDLVLTFDGFTDSDGNPWTVPSGEFKAQVGESLLAVLKRLMDAGLYIELDPDTFELRAWERANHGRDRTGATWGANVLRFQVPTAADRATGNILADLKRAIRAVIRRTWMIVGEADTYGTATAAGDVPWEGFYPSDAANVPALEAIASTQITARNDAGDTVQVRIKLGNDPANGYYRPGVHVLPDDLATIHSGSGTWDWDEAAYPVAEWRIATRRSGASDAWVHLGATYEGPGDRQFQVPSPVGRHSHRPNPELCRPGTASSTPVVEETAVGGDSGSGYNTSWAIANYGSDTYLLVGVAFRGPDWTNAELVNGVRWEPDTTNPATYEPLTRLGRVVGTTMSMEIWGRANPTPAVGANGRLYMGPGTSSDRTAWCGALVSGVSETPTVSSGAAGTGTSGSESVTAATAALVLNWGGIANTAPLAAALGLTELNEQQLSTASSKVSCAIGSKTSDGSPEDVGWTFANIEWATLSAVLAGNAGAANDGHADLVQTGTKASRCRHRHHVLRTAAPTATDDANDGYPITTLWRDTTTGRDYLLTDNSAGAAVWVETTPKLHASSHVAGGADAVKLDDLAAPDDTADLNASSTRHGLLPKLSGSSLDFLNGLGNWAVPGGPSGGGGLSNSTRLRYHDDCAASGLPAGASSTGQLTYDAIKVRRVLGGTSASTYDTPAVTLQGPIIVDVYLEDLNALTTGGCKVSIIRGSTYIAQVNSQTDLNLVIYSGDAVNAKAAGNAGTIATGWRWRYMLSVAEDDVAEYLATIGLGSILGTSGNQTGSLANRHMAGRFTLNTGVAPADSLFVRVETIGTRQVALYGVRIYHGAIPLY